VETQAGGCFKHAQVETTHAQPLSALMSSQSGTMSKVDPPDASFEGSEEKSHAGAPLSFSLEPLSQFDMERVIVEPVQAVDSRFARFGGRCLALRNVLTARECEYLITEMTSHGDLERVSYRQEYRQNDRFVFDTKELSGLLWKRVEPIAKALAFAVDLEDPSKQRLLSAEKEEETSACPEELRVGYGHTGVWRPIGLNECLRFCRYNPGGFFRSHCDAMYKRSEEEMSFFTCMFYLDSGFGGGATRFLRIDGNLTDKNYLKLAEDDQVLASLQPEAGMCLLFFQPGLLHEGEDVKEGSKHILRTDVMFRRDPGTGPQRTPQEEHAWKLLQEAQAAEASNECDKACQLYRRAFKLDPKLERAC